MKLYIKFSNNHTINIIDCNKLFNLQNIVKSTLVFNGSQEDLDILQSIGFRINGQLISNDTYSIELEQNDTISSHIYTLSADNFTDLEDNLNTSFVLSYNNIDVDIAANFYKNDVANLDYSYNKESNMISSNMESFMLLRTNPKLTGNIKLVIDTNYNLFLDTFKVSSTSVLNKDEYRHQPISENGDYPYDIYKTFKSVPSGELFRVYDNSYNAHKQYFDLNLQIENIYEYGAEYNNDNLYSENMKILAPLYIGKHLPTYFAIFKTNRLITQDYTTADADVFKEMLKEAKVVKIYDLRNSTTIGKYLNNYKNNISKFLSGTCYLQFIEQLYDKTDDNYRQGKNTWKGIAVDKGILTEKNETSYFATQTLNNSQSTQENFNMLLLNGYSRNNLVFPNIINLEFMFNDEDSNEFEMNNYFGLYLTENDFITFNQVIKDINVNNISYDYYDENNNKIKLDDTPISIVEDSTYSDRLFFINTLKNTANINNMNDVNMFIKNNVANKPDKNVVSIKSRLVDFSNIKSFISMKFNKQINIGEHFKFIAVNKLNDDNKFENVVLDIIASNDLRLAKTDDNIYPYIATNTPELISDDNEDKKTKYYRLSFLATELDNHNKLASLETQLKRLAACIYKFGGFIVVQSMSSNAIGISSTFDDVNFQHVLQDYSHEQEVDQIEDYIKYFNNNNVTYCYNQPYIPDAYPTDYIALENQGIELSHYRYSSLVGFIKNTNNIIYQIEYDINEALKNIKFPIVYTESGYYPLIKYIISQLNNDNSTLEYNSIISPFDVNKSIIQSPYKISDNDDSINICSPMACNISLMGINSIKDLDMTINDSNSSIQQTQIYASFMKDENIKCDGSDSRLKPYITYKIISGSIQLIPIGSNINFFIADNNIIYIDNGNIVMHQLSNNSITFNQDTIIALSNINLLDLYNYSIDKPLLSENNYYIDPNDTVNSELNIPIVPHINCQWKSNGQYFDHNSLLDVKNLNNLYSVTGNFIETSFSPAGNGIDQYIANKISDSAIIDGKIKSIKDIILSGKANAIKKFLISNNKINTAIGYYNPFVQTLEFIFYGIKFSFKLSNAKYANDIKLNEYDNYEVYIINDYTGANNEIYISTKEEFILIINHKYNNIISTATSNIKVLDTDIKDSNYMWTNALYNYDLLHTYVQMSNNGTFKSAYIKKSLTMSSNVTNKTFVELNLPIYDDIQLDFNETPIYSYGLIDETTDFYDIINDTNHLLIGNDKDITYLSSNNSISKIFNKETSDFRQKNTYIIELSNYQPNTVVSYIDKLNDYIKSFDNQDIDLYIINHDSYKTYNLNNDYKPIEPILSIPPQVDIQTVANNGQYTDRFLKIKYNQGLFNPAFEDIFEFNIKDDISEKIGLDTTYANTEVKNIKKIKNYFCNKISERNSNMIYNYFNISDHSIFSTDWDKNIYRLYTSDNKFDYIEGYKTGLTEKTFFGSKCLNIKKDYIELSKWYYSNNETNTERIAISNHNINANAQNELVLELNITKTFYDYISDSSLYNDWIITNDIGNIKTNINNYINNTLLKVYNFKNNLSIELYKKYTSNVISDYFAKNVDSLEGYEIETNVNTVLSEVNNEIILTINIPNYDSYLYHPIVKIYKN